MPVEQKVSGSESLKKLDSIVKKGQNKEQANYFWRIFDAIQR